RLVTYVYPPDQRVCWDLPVANGNCRRAGLLCTRVRIWFRCSNAGRRHGAHRGTTPSRTGPVGRGEGKRPTRPASGSASHRAAGPGRAFLRSGHHEMSRRNGVHMATSTSIAPVPNLSQVSTIGAVRPAPTARVPTVPAHVLPHRSPTELLAISRQGLA